jgi:glycosyltransferase involved in cell wall biosynthesis
VGHQTDPIRFLAAADAFVLPSLTEGLPGALVEAMAAGLPCVTTDIPGNRELVRDEETGLLVPPQDPTALARALGRILDDPSLAARVAKAGQALVFKEYDESSERSAWQDLFARLRRTPGCNSARSN